MPTIKDKATEQKGLKILTPDKLLTILPVLLAQFKGGYNSCKLKNQIRQILYILYQQNKITKKLSTIESSHYNNRRQRTHSNNRTHFDLPTDAGINLKHEIYYIINELLAEHINMETTFMNTKYKKLNEPHTFILNLSHRLNLRSSNKNVALQNLSIYYTWKI